MLFSLTQGGKRQHQMLGNKHTVFATSEQQ